MRWPFACCGLGYVWPLFIPPPPPTASLSTATNGRKLFSAAHLVLCPWLSPSLQKGGSFSQGLGSGTLFSPAGGSAQGTWMEALPCPECLPGVTCSPLSNRTTAEVELSLTLRSESCTANIPGAPQRTCDPDEGAQTVLPALENIKSRDSTSPPLTHPRTSPHHTRSRFLGYLYKYKEQIDCTHAAM